MKHISKILTKYVINKAFATLNGYDAILRNAPALVVAYAPKEVANNMVDLSIAISYLNLVAPTMGMGTCWAGLFQWALLASHEVKKELGLPAECSERP